ncbi:MAG: hypothetical protein E6J91_01635 [Deltaproteobacteria bacterium]|nr:MAG: hypothetical protein E6J91_01635 [Deltaproteobacteria bacterium]
MVARLRAAGGILLGKTNVPTGGGGGETTNPLHGQTNNPYDTRVHPGSSSGGEAAIIAAGGSPHGLGSDSGGSIRLPAHNCSIAGLRPTVGRVPATGAGHHGDLCDHRSQVGLLARSVADRALAFPLIAGEDWRDASIVAMPIGDPAGVELAHCRVAFYVHDGITAATPATEATVCAAARSLADRGAQLEERVPPGIDQAWDITRGVWQWHRGETTAGAHLRVLARWNRLRSKMLGFLQHHDLIVCPVAACPAVRHGETATTTRPSCSSIRSLQLTG